jgi:hypothetical protein
MTTLDENTKITLRNALAVIFFVISIVSGYFFTLGKISDRVSALENEKKHFDDYKKETALRLDRIDGKQDQMNANQVKILIALGVEPDPPKE